MTTENIQLIAGAVFLPLIITPFWRIYGRAGFSPWLAILMVVPLVNIIVLYYVAFSKWNSTADKGRPEKGLVYTESEIEDFKRRGLM